MLPSNPPCCVLLKFRTFVSARSAFAIACSLGRAAEFGREGKPETRDVGNGSERQGAYEKAARPANIPYILFMVLQCLD